MGQQLSWSISMDQLFAGHRRFLSGLESGRVEFSLKNFSSLNKGQSPLATVLTCADSRMSPEIIFGQSLGELFVVRTAGNFPTTHSIASIEYSVLSLNVPLILILGHTKCGAMSTTLEHFECQEALPTKSLRQLVKDLKPSVLKQSIPEKELYSTIENNVKRSIKEILSRSFEISEKVRAERVKILGGIYDIGTGRIIKVIQDNQSPSKSFFEERRA